MDPSRRDGVIGSDRRATIRKTTNRGQGSDRALRDGILIGPVPGNKLPGYHHLVPPGQTHLRPYIDGHARARNAWLRSFGPSGTTHPSGLDLTNGAGDFSYPSHPPTEISNYQLLRSKTRPKL